jgi:Zn-dependent peptidase ImmA (M78 family)
MELDQNPLEIVARYQRRAPVDLDAIARDLSIPVAYINLGADIAGRIMRDTRNNSRSGFTIQINSTQHTNRQRFTLAHELAHYVLHRDLIESGIVDDTMYRSGMGSHLETQANRMAADIIMPIRLVKKMHEQIRSVDVMANKFGVSRSAMDIRLSGISGLVGQSELF